MRIPYKDLVELMATVESVRNSGRDRWDVSEEGQILKVIEVDPEEWGVPRIGVTFDDAELTQRDEVKKFREEFPKR